MNYTTLIAAKTTAGSIKSWVNYSRLDVAQIVEEAQDLIFQTLRVREMRTVGALSMSGGDSSVAVPADFLDPIKLTDKTNNVDLKLQSESMLENFRAYSGGVLTSGTPARYSIWSEAFQFEFKYSGAASLSLVYFKKPALLVATTGETNFLTDRYPHLLRTACVALAHDFMDNAAEYDKAVARLSGLIQKANEESDLATRGAVLSFGPVNLALGDDRTNYKGLDPDQLYKEAQLLIYQKLRVREMRATATVNVNTNDTTGALPTGFLDPISLKDATNSVWLDLVNDLTLERARSYTIDHGVPTLASGTPRRFAIYGELLQFELKYSAAASLYLVFYKRPTLLTIQDTTTNFLTDRYLHLLTAACEVQVASFRQDAASFQKASAILDALVQKANEESTLSLRSSVLNIGPVRIPLGDDRANTDGIDGDQILKEAQLLLYQTLRVREMRVSTTLTMAALDYYKALPTGFLDPIRLQDSTNTINLRGVTEGKLQALRTYDSGTILSATPVRYAIFDECFQFECSYDAVATLQLIYFKRPTLLTATSTSTNFLTERYLHVLQAACVVQVELFKKDDGAAQAAMQRLGMLIQQTNVESDLSYRDSDYESEA